MSNKKTKQHVCVMCRTLFYSMHTYAKYCSKKCKSKADKVSRRSKKAPPEIQKKSCKVCGKEFLTYFHNQIYCSAQCREVYNNENIKQWQIKNQEQYQIRKKANREKLEMRQKKRQIYKKENDNSKLESISEGVYLSRYTLREDMYLIDNYDKFTKKELAQALNRTISSVQSRYKKLKKYT